MSEFVHLHVHSQYSMLDAPIRLAPLVKRAKELGQRALAVTDHHTMFGAVSLVKYCEEHGIAPILGSELNVAARLDARQHHHLVVLAESQEGYHNLVQLVSRGWVEGLRDGVPRVDLAMLERHQKGLVVLTGCMGGVVAQDVLVQGKAAGAASLARLRDAVTPGALYVELQDHGLAEQKPLNRILVELARELSLPLVATNDCHYLEQKDARAQLALQCIGRGTTLEDAERAHHGRDTMHVRSSDEMAAVFKELPEALAATMAIAERCGGKATPKKKAALPRFVAPVGRTEEEHFRATAAEGLELRFGELRATGRAFDEAAYRARLAFELDMVVKMGFAGYFLIVADFIVWAKTHGCPVGPGRGSGAGSIAAWSLRITDLDPIPYGLLFERFLNPDRVSMPDFDIDFCMDNRDRVIEYVREKYGRTSVGQIATFHLLKSRSVVRDVGRVMKMTPQDAGRIATMIPEPIQGKTVSIEDAMDQEPRLKAVYDDDPRTRDLLDTAMTLEDLVRHAGMHAAGVVISEGPLWDHVPVFCPEPDTYVTQYSKDDVETAGLVKFDFLGLKTLTVIDLAVKLVNRRPDRQDAPVVLEQLPLDDKATYALLSSGETTNVFQLESSGMQQLFRDLKPDRFEDVIAAVALYRPGPLGTGMVADFVQRKHGRAKVDYPHACLKDTLESTYGVIVYQEQVMQAAREMAGYTLGGADLLRRAMGKKKAEEMAQQKATFVAGAVGKGHTTEDAERVFTLIDYFAGYGFNKSHSAAYALITYQTAWLKAHYPVEFTCATLSADKERIERIVRTVAEARTMGITVLPPDVNESDVDFTVVYGADGESEARAKKRKKDTPVAVQGIVRDALGPRIRFGLGAIKGVGGAALEATLEARRDAAVEPGPRRDAASAAGDSMGTGAFRDLFDFCSRVDVRRVNKNVCEALVQSGAFDVVHKTAGVTRAQAFASIESALERGKRLAQERASGQTSLFGLLGDATPTRRSRETDFVAAEPWDVHETLVRERGTLGFYVSGHPLDRYASEVKRFCNATTATLASVSEGAHVIVAGAVEGFRERPTKTGGKIGFFTLEDSVGRVEVIVRQRVLEAARAVLQAGDPVLVTGNVQMERDRPGPDEEPQADVAPTPKLVLEDVAPLAQAFRARTKSVRVKLHVERVTRDKLAALKDALLRNPGPCAVSLELASNDHWSVTLPSTGVKVEPSDALLSTLERLFGEKVCELR